MATTTKAATAASQKTLEDLLEHGLQDIYYAENKILKSLEKMVKAAEDEELRDGLELHHSQTAQQITMLERAFEAMGKKPKSQKCEAMDGILAEGDCVCFEPAGYVPKERVWVRLENTYHITKTGPVNLVEYPFDLVRL